jgi:hypothetical protein
MAEMLQNRARLASGGIVARKASVRHYFVEQDETPASPFSSIKLSIDYLKRLEF